MKSALIIASFFAVAFARPEPPSAYGIPAVAVDTGYGVPAYAPQVYKHVYVHAAPDEAPEHQHRVIRVPGGADKHVNIIFVKAPSSSSHQQTEVVLPEQPQQKTVVYVLVRKGTHTADVKVHKPAAPAPHKPEVFFIRYKDHVSGGYGAPVAVAAPAPIAVAAPVQVAGPAYGAPVQVAGPAYGTPVSSAYGTPVGY